MSWLTCYGVQFFVSKKRKPVSPGLKSGRSKKDAKAITEGSPSAKGTLDKCLVTSQEDNNTSKPSYTAKDSLGGPDAVKRKLALEIENSSKEELKQSFSSEELHPQTSEAIDEAQKETTTGLSAIGDVAVGGSANCCSTFAQGVDNSELKKFTADFLSLYCRYCTQKFQEPFICASS